MHKAKNKFSSGITREAYELALKRFTGLLK